MILENPIVTICQGDDLWRVRSLYFTIKYLKKNGSLNILRLFIMSRILLCHHYVISSGVLIYRSSLGTHPCSGHSNYETFYEAKCGLLLMCFFHMRTLGATHGVKMSEMKNLLVHFMSLRDPIH